MNRAEHYFILLIYIYIYITPSDVRDATSFLLFNAVKYKIGIVIASRMKKWSAIHEKKLCVLRTECVGKNVNSNHVFVRNVVSNFSSYVLSKRESEVLVYSLDRYVPFNNKGKRIDVEFERFFQNLQPHMSNLREDEKLDIKSRCLNAFRGYKKIKLSNSDQEIIYNLRNNTNLSILRQDKGMGVVLLDRSKYIEKSLTFLEGR